MKKILLVVIVILCVTSSISCNSTISTGWSKLELSPNMGGFFNPEYKEFMIEDMPCIAVQWDRGLGVTCDWSAR